jgi:hypothetical protein
MSIRPRARRGRHRRRRGFRRFRHAWGFCGGASERAPASVRLPRPWRGSSACISCRCHMGRDHCVRVWPSWSSEGRHSLYRALLADASSPVDMWTRRTASPTSPQENKSRSSGHLMCYVNRPTTFAIDSRVFGRNGPIRAGRRGAAWITCPERQAAGLAGTLIDRRLGDMSRARSDGA